MSRQSKSGDTGTGDNNTPDSAEDNPLQQDSAQEDGDAGPHERAKEEEVEDYMPPSEDEASLDDDEFVVPEDPVEQERFKRRLMAMANSLKKKQHSFKLIKTCWLTDGLKSLRPKSINSNAPPRATQSAGCYPD